MVHVFKQTFIEHPLCESNYSKHLGYSSEQKDKDLSALGSSPLLVNDDRQHANKHSKYMNHMVYEEVVNAKKEEKVG